MLLSQPAGFYFGEGILRHVGQEIGALGDWWEDGEELHILWREIFFSGKEKSGFKVDFGDFYCPICHPALSLPQKTISKVYVAHEALVNWGEMKIGILAAAF